MILRITVNIDLFNIITISMVVVPQVKFKVYYIDFK